MTSQVTKGILLLAVAGATLSPALGAQTVRVIVPEENFRKAPSASSANRLATVLEGSLLQVRDRQGRWLSAELEGWVWAESVESTDRDGFDLIVTRPGGENLRREPAAGAPRAARLMRGMLLDSIGAEGEWIRVRRAAWVWAASTAETEASVPASPPVVSEEPPGPESLPDRLVVGGAPTPLLVSPDGDTVAVMRSGTDMEVLARQGGWSRVRLEGWVWEPSTLPPDSAGAAGFTIADLRANPDQFAGRRVEWTLRFISLERAEPIRRDFYEGEPYLLMSAPAETRDLVYVVVPPELLPAVEQLQSLATLDVIARVRTGRSQTGVPILDLLAVR